MRILHEAAIALHVMDDSAGETLPDAVVSCPAVGHAGVRNAAGYHVFSDLRPGEYKFSIQRPGYGARRLAISYPGAGCRVFTVRLPYSQTHPRIRQLRHLLFLLSDEGGALAGKEASIVMKTPSPLLRVVEDAAQGETLLALNAEPRAELLARELQDDEGTPHFLTEIAPEDRAYRLDAPLGRELRSGSRLMPVWRFETDWEGAAVLPIQPLLMPEGPLSFTVVCGGRERTVEVEAFEKNECRVAVRF